jgi:hypothetical protein
MSRLVPLCAQYVNIGIDTTSKSSRRLASYAARRPVPRARRPWTARYGSSTRLSSHVLTARSRLLTSRPRTRRRDQAPLNRVYGMSRLDSRSPKTQRRSASPPPRVHQLRDSCSPSPRAPARRMSTAASMPIYSTSALYSPPPRHGALFNLPRTP